jgi:hypothetical protein
MSERAGAGDKMAAQVAQGPSGPVEAVGAPRFVGDFECWGKDEKGEPVVVWKDRFENVVVNQGRQLIINRLFASWTSYDNAFLFLHGASTGSANVWSNISASQISGYATQIPRVTFSTQSTLAGDVGANTHTATASYGFTIAGTQTVSGAGIIFYTNTSCATNFATTDGRMYCYGTFNGGAQNVQSNNTLSATLTVSFNSA